MIPASKKCRKQSPPCELHIYVVPDDLSPRYSDASMHMGPREPPPQRTSALRLLLVEDNPLFAEQICEATKELPQTWRIHLIADGLSALEVLNRAEAPFDLALVDLGLPDISGIEVIKACNKLYPDMPVVVISVIAAEPTVLSAIEAGARGYILKDESIQEITQGISQVLDGIYPLSPMLARYLFKKLTLEKPEQTPTPSPAPALPPDMQLTPRELETLQHLSKGLTYEGVADQMGVTLSTIQWNVRNLYRKLNVRSQVQAASKARSLGLL